MATTARPVLDGEIVQIPRRLLHPGPPIVRDRYFLTADPLSEVPCSMNTNIDLAWELSRRNRNGYIPDVLALRAQKRPYDLFDSVLHSYNPALHRATSDVLQLDHFRAAFVPSMARSDSVAKHDPKTYRVRLRRAVTGETLIPENCTDFMVPWKCDWLAVNDEKQIHHLLSAVERILERPRATYALLYTVKPPRNPKWSRHDANTGGKQIRFDRWPNKSTAICHYFLRTLILSLV